MATGRVTSSTGDATGVSAGKLNLKLESVPADRLETVVEDRRSGRTLRFRVRPELARSILDVPMDRLESEGMRVMRLDDAAIFAVEEVKGPKAADPPRPSAP